jgi:hypothetical protein
VQQLTEAPFQVTWQPAVYAVHASDGINISTIKDVFKQLHVVSHIALIDLAARLDPADPLCAEVASAAAEGQQHAAAAEGARYGGTAHFLNMLFHPEPVEVQTVRAYRCYCCMPCVPHTPVTRLTPVCLPLLHCSLPVSAAAKLLQRQFAKEEVLAWKFEVVRRRDQLAKAEAEAQASMAGDGPHLRERPICRTASIQDAI